MFLVGGRFLSSYYCGKWRFLWAIYQHIWSKYQRHIIWFSTLFMLLMKCKNFQEQLFLWFTHFENQNSLEFTLNTLCTASSYSLVLSYLSSKLKWNWKLNGWNLTQILLMHVPAMLFSCDWLRKSSPCLTVHLEGAWSFGFAHAVLWHAGVRALVLTSRLGQAQAVVTADLKSGKNIITQDLAQNAMHCFSPVVCEFNV